ncbi:MAG: hypothetical protein ACK5LM_05755 [Lactovum sp.]
MTLKELLEIMTERDLTTEELDLLNQSRTSIVETVKMALDSYGQSEKILNELKGGESNEVEESPSPTDIMNIPADQYSDDE